MIQSEGLDLDIALKKIHQLAVDEGDLGYAYWYSIGLLLEKAAGMQATIDSLSKELEVCRVQLASKQKA